MPCRELSGFPEIPSGSIKLCSSIVVAAYCIPSNTTVRVILNQPAHTRPSYITAGSGLQATAHVSSSERAPVAQLEELVPFAKLYQAGEVHVHAFRAQRVPPHGICTDAEGGQRITLAQQ